jgi:hypothetical protein|tara:strand:- start:336 stop:461 length:126 start_codon:yes stop_codon:yes gene_type:complete
MLGCFISKVKKELSNKAGKIIYKYLGSLTKEIIKNELDPFL